MIDLKDEAKALEEITRAIGEARYGAYVLYEIDEHLAVEIDNRLVDVLTYIYRIAKKSQPSGRMSNDSLVGRKVVSSFRRR